MSRDGKGFFNEGQYLLITESSVSEVRRLVAEGGLETRETQRDFNFRPNMVISGASMEPYAEVTRARNICEVLSVESLTFDPLRGRLVESRHRYLCI